MSPSIVRLILSLGLILTASVFSAGALVAQDTGTLTGQVTAEGTLQPLARGQVSIAALNIGTLTRDDGRYLLTGVPAGTHTLQVMFLGYATTSQQVTVQGGQTTTADFALAVSAINLDEMVVTGTGAPTQRRQLGQTIYAVQSEDLVAAPITDMSQALQGRIPGLTGTSFGGEGAGSRLRLRGTVSLSQRNEPLIYVDGVRMDNSFNSNSNIGTSRLNDIDPSNIERIEVIKGAAAATLFGTEASSGVIQIFTKRGMTSDPVYSFRMDQRITSIDAEEGLPINYRWDPSVNQLFTNQPGPDFISPAWQQDYSASVRGGTPGVKYFASGRIADKAGSAPKNAVQNYALRTALDFQHTDKFSSSFDVNLVRNNNDATYPTWGAYAEYMLANPSKETEQRPYGEQDWTIQGALDFTSVEETDNRMLSGQVAYAWTPNVNSTFRVGLNDVNVETTRWVPKGLGNPNAPEDGLRFIENNKRTNWTLDFKNSAIIGLTDNIQSTTVVGAQSFWESTQQYNANVRDFASASLNTLRGGATVTNVDEWYQEVINGGVFIQEQLAIGGTLFLTGGLRADGNSAFGEDFSLQYYPKVGASWVVSEESFWNMDAFQQVRVRAAYGESGLQPGAFDAQQTWAPASGIENNQAVRPLNLGNSELKPERSAELEFGLEFTILDGHLGVEAVYFDQKTTDALLPATVSPSLGFANAQLTNIGALESSGLEISTNWTVFDNPTWGLNLNGTYTTISQTVTDMGGVPAFRIEGRRRWSQIAEGFSPGAVIAPVHDPNNPFSTSVPIDEVTSHTQIQPNWLKDASGADSLVYIGESAPTWTASFAPTLRMPGNLTARALLRAEGNFIMSRESELIRQNLHYNAFMADLDQALDPDGGIPIERKRELINQYGMRHPNMFSDWMEDASYMQVQEVSLTWQVPQDLAAGWGLSNTMVSFNARNLWIYSPNYHGIVDPGAGFGNRSEFVQNVDYMEGPSPKTFGITVSTSLR
jgi:outer membrane receptor protein involved in Fe transport